MSNKLSTTKGKRGGKRVKRLKSTNAQQALLRAIIEAYGGPRKIATFVYDITKDKSFYDRCFINWRNREGVPLVHCQTLARTLKLPAEVFNYKMVSAANPGKVKTWEQAVKSCLQLIGKSRVDYILSRG